jgi:hypothetical protein
VGVLPNPLIFGDDDRVTIARGRHDDLVGRIPMKGRREPAALDENRPRQLNHL